MKTVESVESLLEKIHAVEKAKQLELECDFPHIYEQYLEIKFNLYPFFPWDEEPDYKDLYDYASCVLERVEALPSYQEILDKFHLTEYEGSLEDLLA